VLDALDWVRREMMHRGSPDFIRQRELAGSVHRLAERLARINSASCPHPSEELLPPTTNRK
jgi:hypothetical protein